MGSQHSHPEKSPPSGGNPFSPDHPGLASPFVYNTSATSPVSTPAFLSPSSVKTPADSNSAMSSPLSPPKWSSRMNQETLAILDGVETNQSPWSPDARSLGSPEQAEVRQARSFFVTSRKGLVTQSPPRWLSKEARGDGDDVEPMPALKKQVLEEPSPSEVPEAKKDSSFLSSPTNFLKNLSSREWPFKKTQESQDEEEMLPSMSEPTEEPSFIETRKVKSFMVSRKKGSVNLTPPIWPAKAAPTDVTASEAEENVSTPQEPEAETSSWELDMKKMKSFLVSRKMGTLNLSPARYHIKDLQEKAPPKKEKTEPLPPSPSDLDLTEASPQPAPVVYDFPRWRISVLKTTSQTDLADAKRSSSTTQGQEGSTTSQVDAAMSKDRKHEKDRGQRFIKIPLTKPTRKDTSLAKGTSAKEMLTEKGLRISKSPLSKTIKRESSKTFLAKATSSHERLTDRDLRLSKSPLSKTIKKGESKTSLVITSSSEERLTDRGLRITKSPLNKTMRKEDSKTLFVKTAPSKQSLTERVQQRSSSTDDKSLRQKVIEKLSMFNYEDFAPFLSKSSISKEREFQKERTKSYTRVVEKASFHKLISTKVSPSSSKTGLNKEGNRKNDRGRPHVAAFNSKSPRAGVEKRAKSAIERVKVYAFKEPLPRALSRDSTAVVPNPKRHHPFHKHQAASDDKVMLSKTAKAKHLSDYMGLSFKSGQKGVQVKSRETSQTAKQPAGEAKTVHKSRSVVTPKEQKKVSLRGSDTDQTKAEFGFSPYSIHQVGKTMLHHWRQNELRKSAERASAVQSEVKVTRSPERAHGRRQSPAKTLPDNSSFSRPLKPSAKSEMALNQTSKTKPARARPSPRQQSHSPKSSGWRVATGSFDVGSYGPWPSVKKEPEMPAKIAKSRSAWRKIEEETARPSLGGLDLRDSSPAKPKVRATTIAPNPKEMSKGGSFFSPPGRDSARTIATKSRTDCKGSGSMVGALHVRHRP